MSSELVTKPMNREDLAAIRTRLAEEIEARRKPSPDAQGRRDVLVCAGGGCIASKALPIADTMEAAIREAGIGDKARVVRVGCLGLCDAGPLILVAPDGVYYPKVGAKAAARIVQEHLVEGRKVDDLELKWTGPAGEEKRSFDVPFFARQVKIALRNCGVVDPAEIDETIATGGYAALEKVLFEMKEEDVLDELKRSGLRGRGGAGFPVGLKWQFVAETPGDEKYVVCNADEGDPGAFMDRSILEGDPHSVIEAMTIAGRVIGSNQGYVYVRAEYPLAIERLGRALSQARAYGLLGENILGTDFTFDLEIRIGAGAFVCGEETALMHSIEGKRGMPRPRPPFPAQKGLFNRPTLLNNVESYANVGAILLKGSKWYSAIGSGRSQGTKVFALAGEVTNTGLVEVPMGISLREVVDEIGGGIKTGRPFKAAQSGGPSGGCIPATSADVPIDYESLQELGSIMGSGGLVIMDETSCMVELSRFFMEFLVDESCGKCPPCRIGTKVMLNLLEKITKGEATDEDIATLESVAEHVKTSSLCGLGQTAPSAVISTLRHYRAEYDAHVREKRCPSLQCKALLTYTIEKELCNGCQSCARECPVDAIVGEVKLAHEIMQDVCIHCGACMGVCPTEAVKAS